MGVKVAVHIKEDRGANTWSGHEQCELTRVPAVGEYISFDHDKSPGYKVTLVNHSAFDADYDAEIFVIPADGEEVRQAAGWKQ